MNRRPAMEGTIERRLLVNYRVAVDVLDRLLPPPFRPLVVEGVGMAGICMIRLTHVRPLGLPGVFGLTTENAAHRIAVEWGGPGASCRGVYIPRRDTSSRLTVALGGRLFPGRHHLAHFDVGETAGQINIAFTSADGTAHAGVTADVVADLPPDSAFTTLDEASTFFQMAPVGYSPTRHSGRYEGLELQCATWKVQPLRVEHAESSFFEDASIFPCDTVELDSALVMRDIPAVWRPYPPWTATQPLAQATFGSGGPI